MISHIIVWFYSSTSTVPSRFTLQFTVTQLFVIFLKCIQSTGVDYILLRVWPSSDARPSGGHTVRENLCSLLQKLSIINSSLALGMRCCASLSTPCWNFVFCNCCEFICATSLLYLDSNVSLKLSIIVGFKVSAPFKILKPCGEGGDMFTPFRAEPDIIPV